MSLKNSMLALAAIVSVACSVLAPMSAYARDHRPGSRDYNHGHMGYQHRPGSQDYNHGHMD